MLIVHLYKDVKARSMLYVSIADMLTISHLFVPTVDNLSHWLQQRTKNYIHRSVLEIEECVTAGLVMFTDLCVSFTWKVWEQVALARRALYRNMMLETYGNLLSGSMCSSPLYSPSGPDHLPCLSYGKLGYPRNPQ